MHSDQPCFPTLGHKDERKLLSFLIGKTNQDQSNENSRGYLFRTWRELGVAICVLGEGSKKTVEGLRRCLLGLFWFSWYHGQDPGKVLFVNQIPTIGLMLHKSLPSYLDFH